MSTIDIPEAIKKLQSQVALLATSTTSLAAQFSAIGTLAMACSSQARRTQAIADAAQFDPSGYTALDDGLWCHSFYCSVLHKRAAEGTSEYLLTADLGTGVKLPVGKFDHAPGAKEISDALLHVGLLEADLPIGYDYAINVNTSNDYPSNFLSSTLRDCAVDELILGLAPDERPAILLFEIHPDGTQCEEQWIDIDEWIQERGLPSRELAPTVRERS